MRLSRPYRVNVTLPVTGCVLAAAAVTAVATVVAMAAPGTEHVAASHSEPRTEQLPQAVDYLTAAYHIDAKEAERRLNLQHDLPALDRRLRQRLPAQYAGMWLDQAHGGTLMIATTRPRQLPSVLGRLPDRAHVRAKQVRWSLRDLEATQRRLASGLRTGHRENSDLAIDEQSNKVVVYRDRTRSGAAAMASSKARRAVAAEAGRVTIKPLPMSGRPLAGSASSLAADPPFRKPGPCHILMCSPPMRAGLRLDIPRYNQQGQFLSYGVCTAAFNLRDRNNRYYTLTAGHCVGNAHTHANIDRTYHLAKPVGVEDPGLVDYDPDHPGGRDWAIMPYKDIDAANYWIGNYDTPDQSLLETWCKPDTRTRCTGNGAHHVSGVATPSEIKGGMVVCATSSVTEFGGSYGWFPGTRCGNVSGRTSWGVDTDICNRPGDSGSPLYDPTTNRAIGILQSGTSEDGACPPRPTRVRGTYTQLFWILQQEQQPDRHPNLALRVICWPRGQDCPGNP